MDPLRPLRGTPIAVLLSRSIRSGQSDAWLTRMDRDRNRRAGRVDRGRDGGGSGGDEANGCSCQCTAPGMPMCTGTDMPGGAAAATLLGTYVSCGSGRYAGW